MTEQERDDLERALRNIAQGLRLVAEGEVVLERANIAISTAGSKLGREAITLLLTRVSTALMTGVVEPQQWPVPGVPREAPE